MQSRIIGVGMDANARLLQSPDRMPRRPIFRVAGSANNTCWWGRREQNPPLGTASREIRLVDDGIAVIDTIDAQRSIAVSTLVHFVPNSPAWAVVLSPAFRAAR